MNTFSLQILLLFLAFQGLSQNAENINKSISVNYKNAKIETVIPDIEAKTNFRFSYNPVIFKTFAPVTYSANNQPLQSILMEILDGGISFKVRGNYIIFQKKKEEEREFLVMGYISNESTNEKIFNASVYEPTTLASTLSNRYGYYQIRLKRDLNYIDLKVQKKDFVSESVKIPFRKDGKVNIALAEKVIVKPAAISLLSNIKIKPDTIKVAKPDSVAQVKPIIIASDPAPKIEPKAKPFENIGPIIKEKSEKFMDWLMSTTQKTHFTNIQDSLNRSFQLSLLPFIGTNGMMSSAVSNDYSVNILSGVSKSINKFEIGGYLNLVRENVTGVQLAGFANVVGKNQKGLQMSGFSNINFGNSGGVLTAGFINANFGTSKNLMAAGFANFSKGASSGVQMAGFSNININTFQGVQLSSFANLNLKRTKGLQISGFTNLAIDTLTGSQIGVFNLANKMKNGVQIGVFNGVNEAENVLPIGFFSYVRKGGYRRLELGTSELGLAEISFKTGVRAFYNIFSFQYNPLNNGVPKHSFGYGLGSSARITNRFSADLNIMLSQFVTQYWDSESWYNQMANANLNLEFKFSKRLAFFGGPSLTWYTTYDKNFDIEALRLANIQTRTTNWWGNNQKLYSWVGFKAGIRVCNLN